MLDHYTTPAQSKILYRQARSGIRTREAQKSAVVLQATPFSHSGILA
jgi:hypothetical protein